MLLAPPELGPQAMRLLAPLTPARSCCARATDDRTARPEPWERRERQGLGGEHHAPSPRGKSKATAPRGCHQGDRALRNRGTGRYTRVEAT